MKYSRTLLFVLLMGLANVSPLMATSNTWSSFASSIFSNNYSKIAAATAVVAAGVYAYFKASYTWYTKTFDSCNAGGYRTCTYDFRSIACRQSAALAGIQKAYNKLITNLDG